MVEKSLADSAGVPCTIQKLSYSLDPLYLRVEGISLKPGQDLSGFHLEIPALRADMTLEGPFGDKTLVLNKLTLDGLIIRVSRVPAMPEISRRIECVSLNTTLDLRNTYLTNA